MHYDEKQQRLGTLTLSLSILSGLELTDLAYAPLEVLWCWSPTHDSGYKFKKGKE